MILTETEACRKACPFAAGFNASQAGRAFKQGDSIRIDIPTCIGSRCMSWEWFGLDKQAISLETITKAYPEVKGLLQLTEEQAINHGWKVQKGYPYVYRDIPEGERQGQCGRTVVVDIQTNQ